MAKSSTAVQLNCESLGPYFLRIARRLNRIQADKQRVEALRQAEVSLIDAESPPTAELRLMFAFSVLADLVLQSWTIRVRGNVVNLFPPDTSGNSRDVAKESVRKAHLLGRDSQLTEKSVEEFLSGMETNRLTPQGWHSIFSVMRDGPSLAADLESIREASDEPKLTGLSSIIRPYLQFVTNEAVCEHTGLRLGDIWRYFRHTWVNEYKSVPGRSMMVLVRDAASKNHPVIGIAALGSSVVQNKIRDKWIGWHAESEHWSSLFPCDESTVGWIEAALQRLLDSCWTEDLRRDGLIRDKSLLSPDESDLRRLAQEALRCAEAHQREPQKQSHKASKNSSATTDWSALSSTSLFRAKRCRQIEKLLHLKRTFLNAKDEKGVIDFSRTSVRKALNQLVRIVKAEHVGVEMMDITVCGAIPPYNHLLGGKLICLLLCSPEIVQRYKERYQNQVSVIASSMKGEPVQRPPRLVLLCTTSLYGVGSSQYNRIKMPLSQLGVTDSLDQLEYCELGKSEGYGTYHFSRKTLNLCDLLSARLKFGRRVNSIFGEGVNPLMRKLRRALDAVGYPSDEILLHRNQRVTYGIALARNFRQVLLGMSAKPDYLIPADESVDYAELIVDFWRRRWLTARITREDVIERVQEERLTIPRSHGAIVQRPEAREESSELPSS